jgi:hypothetical protein
VLPCSASITSTRTRFDRASLTADGIVDDKRRKQLNIGAATNATQIKHEEQRNTAADGTLLLQGLCWDCHTRKNPSAAQDIDSPEVKRRLALVNAYKRQAGVLGGKVGACQLPECPKSQVLCIPGNEREFHMDHLHPRQCACSICEADPSLRKVGNIASMVYHPAQWTAKQFELELRPEKVRLLHGSCHMTHTGTQRAAGMFTVRTRATAAL